MKEFMSLYKSQISIITKYVLYLYGKDGEKLIFEIEKISDLKHYPIYLPFEG